MDAVDLYLNPVKKLVYLVGHCVGIVALKGPLRDCDNDCDVIVCNPGIREFRTLPKSSFHKFYENKAYSPHSTWINAVGFRYDHKTNDYKVVSFKRYYDVTSRFEVFSLRSDSSWRLVKNVAAEVLTFRLDEEMMQYFDGFFLLVNGMGGTIEPLRSFCFHLAEEVFRKSPMPCLWKHWDMNQIGVYNNESIAIFVRVEKCIDVWVLKEFGVKESWTKQLTIGPLLGLFRPIVFRKNDELVLLQKGAKGQLLYCDPVTLEDTSFRQLEGGRCGLMMSRAIIMV